MKHIAIWDGSLLSTAMLIILFKKNYPLNHVLIFPQEQMMYCKPSEVKFMKNYLKYNSIKYQDISIPKCQSLRINIKYCIDRIYRKMNCHIIQYVSSTDIHRRVNLPAKYYITNQYPLIENNLDKVKCKQIIFNAGFLHDYDQNYSCKKSHNNLK